MTRRTLAEFNAATTTHEWGLYTIRPEYAVGQAGVKRTGQFTHLIRLERIVEDRHPEPGWNEHNGRRFRIMKLGDVFGGGAVCGTRSNGQHTMGAIYSGDTDLVNCDRCLKRYGWEAK